ncbi:MAG: cytochrome c biogenesis protein CcsA [Thermodesulfobacteriota bacterium]
MISEGKRTVLWRLVWFFALAAMMASLYTIFFYAPTERTMGEVQRVFYFHVPTAITAFLAFFLVFLASILFLIKKDRKWDHLARASAEVGLLLTTLVLITGSLWAKPVWNTWWTWDPRLTTTLVLWFIYVAYFMLRSAASGDTGARLAAVLGIVGFVDVPIVFMSIRWWRTIHPVTISPSGILLEPAMLVTLQISLVAFLLFFIVLVRERYKMIVLAERLTFIKHMSLPVTGRFSALKEDN